VSSALREGSFRRGRDGRYRGSGALVAALPLERGPDTAAAFRGAATEAATSRQHCVSGRGATRRDTPSEFAERLAATTLAV
jgi:hypothetical protein